MYNDVLPPGLCAMLGQSTSNAMMHALGGAKESTDETSTNKNIQATDRLQKESSNEACTLYQTIVRSKKSTDVQASCLETKHGGPVRSEKVIDPKVLKTGHRDKTNAAHAELLLHPLAARPSLQGCRAPPVGG
eukprot:CAMPEP_0177388694 /NCGR_PEP_ID=MMETSP0368-20130122/52110_1 /TAXON_ID=447022 ORGANISM="Scrippsiella hangoei-like, Strain SHHI-4" /NCGR_SAMPLE_ID=MMETSP0368 /ASSEMBLY_ACC=CAM_ASM_000363 /LENGTH=132 /DNA_ID=CAMNT_0018853939 /DNA_START=1 /DNA_END=398 /DNA_ORIENTATION=+